MCATSSKKLVIRIVIRRDTLAKVKVQIQSKLLVPAKEFYKWKFAFLSPDHPEYLQDSVVLSSRFQVRLHFTSQRKDVCSWDQILGLEHHVNDPRIIYALDQVYTADPPIHKEPEEVPTKLLGELVDFRGLANIDKAYLPLLEEVCTWHPTLIECQEKRSGVFKQWAFTALGQVLHFLKTTKAEDITEDACQHLQVLWEELESSRFDLTWLEPHVQYALGMKSYCEKADKLAKSDLAKEEEGYEEMDLDTVLGYGNGKCYRK
ncbi:Ubiquitin carboxyl-terminal hydrolase, C-terminal [Sesbania bispinosa]|nr:Ubiquitin carboxyl-terminal hydrolase, C-terminal [Sesbania bispinosa]